MPRWSVPTGNARPRPYRCGAPDIVRRPCSAMARAAPASVSNSRSSAHVIHYLIWHADPNLAAIRRRLGVKGLTPAAGLPESSSGRAEEACVRPARLVEGTALAYHPVGRAEPWPGPVAFLDGVQRMQLVAYAGAAPIYVARDRRGGSGAPGWTAPDGGGGCPTPGHRAAPSPRGRRGRARWPDDRGPSGGRASPSRPRPHPGRARVGPRSRPAGARGGPAVPPALRTAGSWWTAPCRRVRTGPRTGARSASPRATPPCRSTATDLERYLRLPKGHRTSVFAPAEPQRRAGARLGAAAVGVGGPGPLPRPGADRGRAGQRRPPRSRTSSAAG